VTIFAAVIPALVEKNFKKVLAFTAISPVGFMVAGLASNVAIGMAGALMYMLTHAIYKSAMFYAAGNLEEAAGGATLEAIEARKDRLGMTVIGFAMAFLAAISFLFTGGFMAKEFILEGTLHHGHYFVFALIAIGATLNVAVMVKLLVVLFSGWCEKEKTEAPFEQTVPVLVLGVLALLGGFIFKGASGSFDAVSGGEIGEAIHHALTSFHASPLIVVSLAIWILGLALFIALRSDGAPASSAFDSFRNSPVLGRAYDLAEAKRFDAFEVGMVTIRGIAYVVFTYVERLIDVVGNWVIALGSGLFRASLSGIHNGVYSNYLAWVIAGFVLVTGLVLLR
jgi:NADH:ubiquinone oxidoreductase subunit 5 (subunit L)/multisubunit Na+/H+ antiporter MnhA subunit